MNIWKLAGIARGQSTLSGVKVSTLSRLRPLLRRVQLIRGQSVLYSVYDSDGSGLISCRAALFEAVCRMDSEGIVGKWKHGPYVDGRNRSTTWIKVLNANYSQRVGRDDLFKERMGVARADKHTTAIG